jgi:DNA polymerase I
MTEHNETFPTSSIKAGDHLYLIDGSGYIFRAYHALPPLTRKSDGMPMGAVSGFCNMLNKLLQDTRAADQPSHFAVILDASSKTFRNEIYPEYKANRSETPEDLVPQFPLIREAVKAFNVPCIEMEGFEADDIIATYARQAEAIGAKVTIVSSDKDLMQLVGPGIEMYDTMKNRRIGEPEVFEKFGVGPERVIDVQALAGDSTDNVPGVPGIGVKTGALLINEYGDLDTLLENASEIKQIKRRENLIEFADLARISRTLVTLEVNVPVKKPLSELVVNDIDAEVLIGFLKSMELTTLTRRIGERFAIDPDTIGATGASGEDNNPEIPSENLSTGASPTVVAELIRADVSSLTSKSTAYETVTTVEKLQLWVDKAFDHGAVSVDTETTSLDAMQADLVGISLCVEMGKACYIPLGHRSGEGLDFSGDTIDQIDLSVALDLLRPLLKDRSVLKIGQNLKYDALILSRYDVELHPLDDTMLMSYALDAGRGNHGMDELSQHHLGHTPIPFKQIAGTGKSKITFDLVPIDKATEYAAEDADITLRLYEVLRPRLISEKKKTLYETLERPLVPVLMKMEREGIKVDRTVLARLSGDFAQTMAGLEAEIHQLAGEHFNIASPKQLGEVLFDKMSLEGGKKTKTGAWATGADVLEGLAAQGHDLPIKVLNWRQLAKLKNTYTDALPKFINPQTGRVHTSYSLAATTTGRLSSNEPNLQNIPIRTAEGRKIRAAFIADSGNKLISADYSQIELRVLAHIADITSLKQAFADGLDIHAMTASEMFNVAIEGMDASIRRRAKAINFGIIYGISAFGLANQLGISRSEAKNYIDTYFERFPGIQDYMESTKEFCRANGYVETIFGRQVHYPDINSKNPAHRGFIERAAINAPIQGSAADIIRRAMIKMPEALAQARLKARMLLQVHDELIFEAPDSGAEEVIKVVSTTMENACAPALSLSVPLKVDARAADNWEEAH